MAQAIFVILLFQARHAHGANAPIVFGKWKRAGFDFNNPPVFDMGGDAAAGAGVAVGVADRSY
jgi:hypothetical protein